MKYKKLPRFNNIFNLDSFSFISNINNINGVVASIRSLNQNLTFDQQKVLLKSYWSNLKIFCKSINFNALPQLRNGYFTCIKILEQAMDLAEKEKRISVSGNMLRKISKTFLYGLGLIYKGLKEAFKPEWITKTRIKEDVLKRYIFDKNVGLGRKYVFNTLGTDSAVQKMKKLNQRELINVIKLLSIASEKRTKNQWTDLGKGPTPVRILIVTNPIGRDKVYFIYTMAEHIKTSGPYQSRITNPSLTPKKTPFKEAA